MGNIVVQGLVHSVEYLLCVATVPNQAFLSRKLTGDVAGQGSTSLILTLSDPGTYHVHVSVYHHDNAEGCCPSLSPGPVLDTLAKQERLRSWDDSLSSISRSLVVVAAKQRVAVLVTGRLEYLPITIDNLKHNVLHALGPATVVDVDVFVYSFTETLDHQSRHVPNATQNHKYIEMLNPVEFILEPDRPLFEEEGSGIIAGIRFCARWSRDPTVKASAEGHLQIMYGLYRVNLMRKQREVTYGFSYDWVMRLRADVLFTQKIPPLETYKTHQITVPYFHNDRPECQPCLNDRFAFGPAQVMDVYMDHMGLIDRSIERCNWFEFHLFEYLWNKGLEDHVSMCSVIVYTAHEMHTCSHTCLHASTQVLMHT